MSGQNNKYILSTTQPEALRILCGAASEGRGIEVWKKTGGGFLIELSNDEDCYLYNVSTGAVDIRLFRIADQKATRWGRLESGSKMNAQKIYSLWADEGWMSWSRDKLYAISRFFESGAEQTFESGQNLILKSRPPDSLQLFISRDSMIFPDASYISLRWKICYPEKTLQFYDALDMLCLSVQPLHNEYFDGLEIMPSDRDKFLPGEGYRAILSERGNTGSLKDTLYFRLMSEKELNELREFIK